MDQNTVIKVENLHKKFCRSLKRSMFYGSVDVARNMLGMKVDTGHLRKKEFWALKDINFEVKKGETFGLIGANGSGKTTLLRMINGIFPPDRGRLMIKGRIGALIAVGAGFHPHMTGRENIYLNGAILGMTQAEIRKNMDSIIDFAEIGDFLDAPVSTYSSGMYVRLGFAIAIHSRPDIVLVDEILAVGDSKFQRKCLDKIRAMRQNGTTFILVSHNMQNIEAMCPKTILMDHGKQIAIGSPKDLVPIYELILTTGKKIDFAVTEKQSSPKGLNLVKQFEGFGTNDIKVNRFILRGKDEIIKKNFTSEEPLTIEVEINSPMKVDIAYLWSTIIYVKNKISDEENIEPVGIRKKISIDKGKSIIKIPYKNLGLNTGEYKITFDIFDETFSNPFYQGHFGYFFVKKDIPTMLRVGLGTPLCWLDPKVEVKK
ncbi:MAG: ABC transporter ATP-binding protein [Candidatus Moranbacteria bacterium]|nr:ABC transporter ATP-binding protein [Candidatus Moranbacteria bacterium]